MASFKIETKIKYYDHITIRVGLIDRKGFPFIRKDYHEDGSVSSYYGIDMKRKDFKDMQDGKHDG